MEEIFIKGLYILQEGKANRVMTKITIENIVASMQIADELDVKIINRPEEALSYATLSEITEDYLLDEEDDKKSKSTAKKPRKKKPTSTGLTDKELAELEQLESELKSSSKARTTTKKTTTTKPKTTATKPKPKPATASPVIRPSAVGSPNTSSGFRSK